MRKIGEYMFFLIIFSESRFFPNILFRIKNLSETSFQNQESSSALKQETASAANLLIITTNFIILCSRGLKHHPRAHAVWA